MTLSLRFLVDSRVRPLVVVVKKWAKTQGINDASQGTLSSYALTLMVIHYLQGKTWIENWMPLIAVNWNCFTLSLHLLVKKTVGPLSRTHLALIILLDVRRPTKASFFDSSRPFQVFWSGSFSDAKCGCFGAVLSKSLDVWGHLSRNRNKPREGFWTRSLRKGKGVKRQRHELLL